MSDQRTGMTEEQYRQLQEQMNAGTQQSAPTQPVQPQYGQAQAQVNIEPQQGRMSAQQALRERMRAQSKQASQPVTLQQTDTYQPGQSVQQPQQAQQTQQQAQPANSTIINTTQSGDNGGKGFKMSKGLALGIVGILVAACILGYILMSGKGKEESDNAAEPNLDELEWLDPVNNNVFLYTPEEITQLRAAGYTGDEIESYQSQMVPAEDLIKQAEAERDAWVQEAIAPLYDTASDEYKHYVSQTWLTLPQRTDMADWTMLASYYTERKNLDYEKIDVYGNQLFIKVYLDDNVHADWFFLCVSPDEWNKLQDSGNVIVNYTYCTRLVGDDYMTAVEDTDNIYITQASLEIIE